LPKEKKPLAAEDGSEKEEMLLVKMEKIKKIIQVSDVPMFFI